jgi:hypothetical protein
VSDAFSVNDVVWFRRGNFFDAYETVANALASRTNLKARIDRQQFNGGHEILKDKLYVEMRQRDRPTVDSMLDLFLEQVAISLCGGNWIKYNAGLEPVASRIVERDRLIEYPAVFTGLHFARVQYLRFCVGDKVEVPDSFAVFDARMDEAIQVVNVNPSEAADFVGLLGLQKYRSW